MSDSLESEIKAAEARRCAAMVTSDPAVLAAILHDDLQFHHATGAVDNKVAFLAKMAAGRIVYQGISWSEERVSAPGPDSALLTGRMTTSVTVEGAAKQLDNRVMTVWQRNGADWRLLAFQSTPIAG